MKNKKGDKMGFITLDDRSGRIEASLFADAFASAQALLQTDALVVVEGEEQGDDDEPDNVCFISTAGGIIRPDARSGSLLRCR